MKIQRTTIKPAKNPDIAHCKCPICGEKMAVRFNIYGKAYGICIKNPHKINFSKTDSEYIEKYLNAEMSADFNALSVEPLIKKRIIENDRNIVRGRDNGQFEHGEPRRDDDGAGYADNGSTDEQPEQHNPHDVFNALFGD